MNAAPEGEHPSPLITADLYTEGGKLYERRGGKLLCGAILPNGVLCRVAAEIEHMPCDGVARESFFKQATGVDLPVIDPQHWRRAEGLTAAQIADEQRHVPTWSPEHTLRHVLGRPHLAAVLVHHLPNPVAHELAERLQTLVEQAVEAHVRAETAAVNDITAATLARLADEARAKREAITRERFGTPSRLD